MHNISSKTQIQSFMVPNSPERRRLLGLGIGIGTLLGAAGLSSCSFMGNKKPVIGLALGAGAARGFAHVGVIKALEAQGIRPDIVVGSSAGSVIAALLASGATGNDLNRLALNLDEATIADWGLPFVGRFGGVALGQPVATVSFSRACAFGAARQP
jgi:NTE family protein